MLKPEDFAIRPLTEEDSGLVLGWRNQDRVRINMYTDHLISESEHAVWFGHALQDSLSQYFIFMHRGRPVGFISFTGINSLHGRCSWAFYLGEIDVPRGSGSVMEFLALDFAFGVLGIRKLCCEVFTFNDSVIRLHEKFGFVREGLLVQHYLKGDKYEDVVCLARFQGDWKSDRLKLMARCFGKGV